MRSPHSSDWLRDFGLLRLLGIVLWSAFFLILGYIPLAGSEIWVNVAGGRWILEHRALPEADPFMPMAAGMKVVDGEWLSQVILAAVERVAGGDGLSALFALTVLATLLTFGRACSLAGGSRLLGSLGVLVILAIAWSRFTELRPESFGLLCFAALLWLVAASDTGEETPARPKRLRPWFGARLWLGVPLIFALWANLDPSFTAGWALLGGLFVGRVVDVARRTRSPLAVLRDAGARRWICLFELAVAATLLNPYGVHLLTVTFTSPGWDNLRLLPEWQPLVILAPAGRALALSWVAIAFLFRVSRRRIDAAEVVLLLVFSWAAAHGTRLLGWYAPIFALVLAPHLGQLLDRRTPGRLELVVAEWTRPSRLYPSLALTAILLALYLSPVAGAALGQATRTPRQLYGSAAPLELTEYLRGSPPRGLVMAPRRWGDWLTAHGPPGIELMATSRPHRIPGRVWRDHQRATDGAAGWDRLLDRYRAAIVVVDKSGQPQLADAMRRADDWRRIYEDGQAMVLARSAPEPPAAAIGPAEETAGATERAAAAPPEAGP